jgi:hypothetical protein
METTIYRDSEELMKMASRVIEMENGYDSSMRGIFLDRLVSGYVQEKVEETVMMFDTIMENQKDNRRSYGDCDSIVTKLKTKGSLDRFDPVKVKENNDRARVIFSKMYGQLEKSVVSTEEVGLTVVYQAILMDNVFTDNCFLVIKTTCTDSFDGKKTEFHIRKVKPNLRVADLELIHYGDIRDKGFVLSLKSNRTNGMEINGDGGMLDHYYKFKVALRTLHDIHYEIMNYND